jgi:hypothetical protein
LLQLASEFRGKRALTGVAMAAPSSLETRVKSVLALNKLRTGVTFMDAFKIACLGVAATALLALARPDVVEAQDAVASPAPVAAPTELPPPDAVPTVPDAPPAPPAPPAPRHHHVHGMQSAQAETRDAPPAPPPPPAPPAPESMAPPPPPPPPPAMHAVPPMPPVPAVHASADDEDADNDADNDAGNDNDNDSVATVNPGGDKVVKVRVWRDKNGHRHVERTVGKFTQADRERVDQEVRRARVEVARVQPEIEKAIASARVNAKVAEAMRAAEPRIRAEIAKAMADARPEIRRAIAEAHISEKVMKALHDAQPQIDAAMRRANEAERSVRIERTERHGDVSVNADQDNDNDNDNDNDDDKQNDR